MTLSLRTSSATQPGKKSNRPASDTDWTNPGSESNATAVAPSENSTQALLCSQVRMSSG